jgi:hypothetical protein
LSVLRISPSTLSFLSLFLSILPRESLTDGATRWDPLAKVMHASYFNEKGETTPPWIWQ